MLLPHSQTRIIAPRPRRRAVETALVEDLFSSRFFLGCFLLICALYASHSYAQSQFQVSGFGTVGLAVENEDDMSFLRDSNMSKDPEKDGTVLPDSIFGLQLSYRFASSWRATTQFVYRDRSKQDLGESTELAFIGYRPLPDLDLRAGRMGIDMFQLSDFRRVDYANLWVRPPVEVYGWILPQSIDGADAAYSFSTGEYYWRVKVQFGETDALLEAPNGSQAFKNEYNNFIVSTATLNHGSWRYRASYSQADLPVGSTPLLPVLQGVGALAPDPIGAEAREYFSRLSKQSDGEVRYLQASLGYDDGTWVVDTELAQLKATRTWAPAGKSGYFSVGRRFDVLTPYVIYSRFYADKKPVESSADWSLLGPLPIGGGATIDPVFLRDLAKGAINGPLLEQYTFSLGVRWDAAPGVALKAQWDRTEIEKQQYSLWAHEGTQADSDSIVNVFSASLNFIF